MALRDQPYIPLYVMDFLSDEKLRECKAESIGVYIMLMCVMHKSDPYGKILLKPKEKICNSKDRNFATKIAKHLPFTVDVIEAAVAELVEEGVLQYESEDALIQKRMVKDCEISQKRSLSGKKGSDSRYGSPENDVCYGKKDKSAMAKPIANSENEIESEDETEITSETSTDIENEEEKKKKNLIDERFKEFWKAYPRKSSKGTAEKSFKKIAPNKELFDQIMRALELAKRCDQWLKDNGQFIPYPSTWLNQRRWEDEYVVSGGTTSQTQYKNGKPDTLGILESMLGEEGDVF